MEETDEEELSEEIRHEIEEQIRSENNNDFCEHGIYKNYLCIKCNLNKLKGEKAY